MAFTAVLVGAGVRAATSPHAVAADATPYVREVLTDAPRAHWRLGEAVGTVATDETTTNHGTYVGGVALGQPGALSGDPNTAVSFDGADDYAIVADSSALDATTGVSVEAWIKRRKSALQAVVAKPGHSQAKNENYALWITKADRPVAFFGDGSTSVRVEAPSALDTNWHHVVATYDNGTARIYVDGAQRGSKGGTLRLTANSLPLNIGRINGGGNFFGGSLDEVAVYGSALTPSRIQAHYIAGTVTDTAPPIVVLSAPSDGAAIADVTPRFTGTAGTLAGDATTVTVDVYAGPNTAGPHIQSLTTTRTDSGVYSVEASTALGEGPYTAEASQADVSGNLGRSSANTFIVDTSPPPAPTIVSAPANHSASASASFSFADGEAGVSFRCQLDGVGFAACTSPTSYTALGEGSHSFAVKALDTAGNESGTTSHSWSVDTTGPETRVDGGPPDPSKTTAATFAFSASEPASFECELDGAGFVGCVSPKSYTGLSDGTHRFRVRALDSLGNRDATPAVYDWTVDTTAPPPPVIVSGPASPSSSTSASFSFADDEAGVSFRCQLDGGGFAACTSPTSYAGLAEGSHSFAVKAVDGAGNESGTTGHLWTISIAPYVTLTAPNHGTTTNDSTPAFSGTASTAPGDSSVITVKVYSGTAATGTPQRTLSAERNFAGAYGVEASPALVDGTYTAQAEQSDAGGSIGRSSANTFIVDTSPPPAPTIVSAPANQSASASASFSFADGEAGVSFRCQLDGVGFAACTSPTSYTALAEGSHSFAVKALDTAGNESGTTIHSWTVDRTPPAVVLLDPPDGSSTVDATPTFSGTAGTAAGDSGTVTVTVYAGVGTAGTIVQTRTVSRVGASYAVDALPALVDGTYTAQARQSDAAGNTGSSSANVFVVGSPGDTIAPTVTLTAPADASSTDDITPAFAGTAGTSSGDSQSVTVKVYSGGLATGPVVQTLTTARDAAGAYSIDAGSPLPAGRYTAQAEQSDSAGNVGRSTPVTFTVRSGYRREVLADGPRGYWRLGEQSGSTAADETAVNNGTYKNGVALARPGALASDADSAAAFDGVDDYILTPDSSSLDATTAVTVEAWIKRSKSAAWQVVAGKPGNGASQYENYALWFSTADQAVAYFGNGSSYTSVRTPSTVDTNWHHIVATYDNATAKIYVDGALKASAASTVALTANALPLNLGRANGGSSSFGGALDEVAVYATALPAARIQAHYEAATTFDTTSPTVTLTSPANGSVTNDATPTFSGVGGTASGDSATVTVKLYQGTTVDGALIETLTATRQAGGAYSVDAIAPLTTGTYTAQAEQTDASGNRGRSSANTFTVSTGDFTPPAVTLITPSDGSAAASSTPTFAGRAGTGAGDSATVVVRVYAGIGAAGKLLQTRSATATADGNYSVVAQPALADGTYTAQAEQSDAAGNVGRSAMNTFSVGPTYRDDIMTDTPVSYWRLGETTGTVASDETGQNNGTYRAGVALASPGALASDRNTAAFFDGVDDNVLVADSSSLDATTAVSIEAWIKRSKSAAWQVVVGKPGTGASENESYALWLTPNDQAVAYFGNGVGNVSVRTPGPLDTSWHHVVSTYDNATAKIYVDGVLAASATSTVALTPNALPLNFARTNSGSSKFGGALDEVAIYAKALSAARVEAHYAKASAPDTASPVVTLTTPEPASSTTDTTPVFAGMAALSTTDNANVVVRIYAGPTAAGTPVQTVTATRSSSGSWSASVSAPLAQGTYTARAEQSDAAGNTGYTSANTFAVVGRSSPTDPVFVGAGDIADVPAGAAGGDEATARLLDAIVAATPGNVTVFAAGDNAYESGTLAEYTSYYEPTWGRHKAITKPIPGNHEYSTPGASGYFDYFGASAGDRASGYYAYDLGRWRIYALNSGIPDGAGSAQEQWLRSDLVANGSARCVLAYMHHPRFSGGVHGNDTSVQALWQALYDYGADVVVVGHDHNYQRFAPQTPTGAADPARGMREFVVGTGGRSRHMAGPTVNQETFKDDTYGVLKMTLHSESYDFEFVPEAGVTYTDSGSASCR